MFALGLFFCGVRRCVLNPPTINNFFFQKCLAAVAYAADSGHFSECLAAVAFDHKTSQSNSRHLALLCSRDKWSSSEGVRWAAVAMTWSAFFCKVSRERIRCWPCTAARDIKQNIAVIKCRTVEVTLYSNFRCYFKLFTFCFFQTVYLLLVYNCLHFNCVSICLRLLVFNCLLFLVSNCLHIAFLRFKMITFARFKLFTFARFKLLTFSRF